MKKLFEPMRYRAFHAPNRVAVPAMVTRLSGEDGHVNQPILDRYSRFSRGEAGLVVVEAMAVHRAKSGPLLRICGDEFKPGLRSLASAMHDSGPGLAVPQIIHFLKVARSGWRQLVSDLSFEDVGGVVRAYAEAAVRARDCGFDGVELHMAHAYTLASFLSRLNPRRDDYGGSLERRLRLPLEVIEAVRAAVGEDFPVGLRFDGEECVKGGYTVAESRLIALRLASAGLDYLSISAGGKFEDAKPREGQPLYPYTGYSGERCMPGAHYPDAPNLYIPATIRAFLRERGCEVPVLAAGKIGTPELAESILEDGRADLIGMARPLLADPDWPRKVREGRFDRVIRCCYANLCKARDEHFRTVTCYLWPKGNLQAPDSADREPPQWPTEGARLTTTAENGRIALRWNVATDNEAVLGYDIWRAEGEQPLERVWAVPAGVRSWHDGGVIAGLDYRYAVQAYDLAGNRSEFSETVECRLPA